MTTAHIALSCMDLTSLNTNDTTQDIDALCKKAQSSYGHVAAVCVWPRFVKQARSLLPPTIAVAAVSNFPSGNLDILVVDQEIEEIRNGGGQEVDVVLPYTALIAGNDAFVTLFLNHVRQKTQGLLLKVILETGMLTPELIAKASELCIAANVDFIKTSTGKTEVNATPEAASIMLKAIASDPIENKNIGFKASGGIKTVSDAEIYQNLVTHYLGAEALQSKRFRIGASSLLAHLEQVLSGTKPTVSTPQTY